MLTRRAAAWPQAQRLISNGDYAWSDFEPGFAAVIKGVVPRPAAGGRHARDVCVAACNGLVALEVYGNSDPRYETRRGCTALNCST